MRLLARDACFAASVPNYATVQASALPAIPHLYFLDPIGGRTREGVRVKPDFGVDISGFMDAKRQMLLAHESQVARVARQHGIADYLASMERWAERRGRDFGVVHAEGFRQYRHQPYPASPALQELVGEALLAPDGLARVGPPGGKRSNEARVYSSPDGEISCATLPRGEPIGWSRSPRADVASMPLRAGLESICAHSWRVWHTRGPARRDPVTSSCRQTVWLGL